MGPGFIATTIARSDISEFLPMQSESIYLLSAVITEYQFLSDLVPSVQASCTFVRTNAGAMFAVMHFKVRTRACMSRYVRWTL